MQGRQREADRHACPNLVDRMTVRQGVPRPDIEGQVLAGLPDQTDEAGDGFRLAKFLLVEDFSDRAHSPLRWPFDDHASKEISVLLTGELGEAVQMNCSPVPALRYDAGQACTELRGAAAVGQQHTELGCDARPGFVLKTALSQYTFEECASGCEARRTRRRER